MCFFFLFCFFWKCRWTQCRHETFWLSVRCLFSVRFVCRRTSDERAPEWVQSSRAKVGRSPSPPRRGKVPLGEKEAGVGLVGSGGEATGFPSSSRGTKKKYTHTHIYIYIYRYLSLASSSSYPPYSSDFSSFVAFSETHTGSIDRVRWSLRWLAHTCRRLYGAWPFIHCTHLHWSGCWDDWPQAAGETTIFPYTFLSFPRIFSLVFFNFRVFDINVQKKETCHLWTCRVPGIFGADNIGIGCGWRDRRRNSFGAGIGSWRRNFATSGRSPCSLHRWWLHSGRPNSCRRTPCTGWSRFAL